MNVRNEVENLSQIPLARPVSNGSTGKSTGTNPSEGLQPDNAQLSAIATQAAQSASISDVRYDKVASIQGALQSGTYHVPALQVAQKVVSAMLAPEK